MKSDVLTKLKEKLLNRPALKPKIYPKTIICPYCHGEADETTGKYVYPHRPDLAELRFFVCLPCDARVGCHKESGEPYGRLANSELRGLKMDAHRSFDTLWRGDHRVFTREKAYKWLAQELGIERTECHIGMFDEATCRDVIMLCDD